MIHEDNCRQGEEGLHGAREATDPRRRCVDEKTFDHGVQKRQQDLDTPCQRYQVMGDLTDSVPYWLYTSRCQQKGQLPS